MKKRQINQLVLGFTCATMLVSLPLFGAETSVNPPINTVNQDFTFVGKKAIPAVVSIQIKGTVQKNNGWDASDLEEYSDPQERFWGRFFGLSPNQTPQQQVQISQGSGFIVSSDGHILTNSHVVKDANEITVVLNDGKEYKGTLIGLDTNTDVAVLKIDAKDLPFITLGNSDLLDIGQWVVAIGNPYGLQASLTVGVVSAKGRNNLDLARIEDFIQTDAAINRGNSGGPLLNLKGEVIGMNTAIVTNNIAGGYVGIGFAIPSNIAKHVMDQLIAKGSVTRGFIGVTLQKVDNGLAAAFNLSTAEGALIAEVLKNSPAEKSGIKQGDVVVKYNQTPVTNIAALRNAIALMTPGTKVNLSLLRKGKPMDIDIVIGDYPEATIAKGTYQDSKIGITVDNITPEMTRNGALGEFKGVIISKVDESSLAAWAGLRKGAIILAVNHSKIENVDQYNAALNATEKGKPVLFLIKQGDSVRYVSFKIS